MAHWIEAAADALFMPWIVVLLFGAGLFLTIRYRFAQFRLFPEALRSVLGRESDGTRGALTPFQAFMTALAASIGTGNVAGVATAIISGGPGALFWIWCYGLVAMAIKLTEAVLGRQFRVTSAGGLSTGPMYYLRDGLKSPTLAWIYALVAGVAALTTTPFTQPNSIADVLRAQVGDSDDRLGHRPRRADVAGDHRRAHADRACRRAALAAEGRALPRRWPGGHRDLRGAAARGARARRHRGVLDACRRRRLGRCRDARRAALRPGPRHLRQRGRLRHGGCRLRHGGEPRAGAAGAARRARGVHRFLRHVDDQRAGAAAHRGLAVGRARRRRRGPRLRRGDARLRRLGGRLLRVPVRLHDADRLGLLRRAVPRVPARTPHQRAVSLDLLPADPVRGGVTRRRRVGVGRPDERPAGVSQHDRPDRAQWSGGGGTRGT